RLRDPPRVVGQRRELGRERRPDRRGAAPLRQLLEVEGIAATLAGQVPGGAADQLTGRRLVERAEGEAEQAALAFDRGELAGDRLRSRVPAVGEREQDRGFGAAAQQERGQLQR